MFFRILSDVSDYNTSISVISWRPSVQPKNKFARNKSMYVIKSCHQKPHQKPSFTHHVQPFLKSIQFSIEFPNSYSSLLQFWRNWTPWVKLWRLRQKNVQSTYWNIRHGKSSKEMHMTQDICEIINATRIIWSRPPEEGEVPVTSVHALPATR